MTEIKELKNQLLNQETKFKGEKDRFTIEKEELNKTVQRLISKETQYKHELKNKDLQIEKYKDSFKAKMFEKAGKQQITGSIEIQGTVQPGDLKFSKNGGDSDFNLMIAKN